jgi:hypothetical protein
MALPLIGGARDWIMIFELVLALANRVQLMFRFKVRSLVELVSLFSFSDGMECHYEVGLRRKLLYYWITFWFILPLLVLGSVHLQSVM